MGAAHFRSDDEEKCYAWVAFAGQFAIAEHAAAVKAAQYFD